ncbi:phage terminase small subunit [Listeria ilorinensis]|uniref:phage terminase small subunit n=1 Tax=Listeria ilorinensis TaxID=2867439 RepID=UPI001EF65EA6|nr:phage terminase small subunit [Listeria ilorinensis]
MARKRDQRRDEAMRLWLDSAGEMKLVDIANRLGCSGSQIRKWKSQDKWSIEDNKRSVTESNSNVTNEKERYQSLKGNKNAAGNSGGAPLGNGNAIGNAGGGAPLGNKNAVTTGEHESLSWEFLTEKERELYVSLEGDSAKGMDAVIRELEIRRLRMMERIYNINNGMTDEEKSTLEQLRDVDYVGTKDGQKVRLTKEKLVTVEVRKKTTAKIDRLLSIENSLNNVTNLYIKAIKQKSDLEQAEVKRELTRSQTSINRERLVKPEQVSNTPNFSAMSTEELRIYANDLKPTT